MVKFKGSIMILLSQIVTLFWVMKQTTAAITYDPNCNYFQVAELNQTYYIYNPRLEGENKCRWNVISPPNTILQLFCDQVNIPSSPGCESGDFLIVSPTGSENFSDGHRYCGNGKFSINSETNKMTIGFFSNQNTVGSTFLCSLGVVEPNRCDCGWRNMRRIVGGVDTGVNEYPMMAGLVDLEQVAVFCGGTIISNNYIVTAAHCLYRAVVKNVAVLVGDWDLDSGMDTPKAKLYNSKGFIIHPGFSSVTFANDIALISTQKPIQFSLEVGPVCLPILYQTTNFQGTYVTELGWGTLGFGEAPSDILQKVDVRWISFEVCKQIYPQIQSRLQFCTYSDNKDSCQGDSGGPAVWQRNQTSRLQLLGIISSGDACAARNRPGINTLVPNYVKWIRDNTPGESYCARI